MESDEAPEETSVRSESAFKLTCNINGGMGADANIGFVKFAPLGGWYMLVYCACWFFVSEGMELGLKGEVEKWSEDNQANLIFSKTQQVTSLPPLLCIHYMRFFWKETPESRDHVGVKCKIRKSVQYSSLFDPLQHCTPALKEKLLVNRRTREEVREQMRSLRMDEEEETGEVVDEETRRALEMSMEGGGEEGEGKKEEEENDDDVGTGWSPSLPANWCGEYELFGVVTHKGRSADSGHYIGWVKVEEGKWIKFDDDQVSETTEDKIMDLKGGGDWHTAYLAFYRAVVRD